MKTTIIHACFAGALAVMPVVLRAADAPSPPAGIEETIPIRVAGGAVAYPEVARKGGIEGDVTAWVYIDATGEVTSVKIKESPHDLLSDAVVSTLSRWKFTPATKAGKPVSFIGEYVIQFRLSDTEPTLKL